MSLLRACASTSYWIYFLLYSEESGIIDSGELIETNKRIVAQGMFSKRDSLAICRPSLSFSVSISVSLEEPRVLLFMETRLCRVSIYRRQYIVFCFIAVVAVNISSP